MNGITVIMERMFCLRFSNFEATITMDIITRMGIKSARIQIEPGSPAPIGQHETKVFQYGPLTNV
jgi:hypothetical protein